MINVTKISSADAAFAYYSERDDYYLSDKASAEWYGGGAEQLCLRGDIDPTTFKQVLAGTYGAAAVSNPDRHTPGWDVTFSAPKSVSIVGLVDKDPRVTAAHDSAVRAALDHIERHAIITRQRDGSGAYAYRATGSMVAGVVRHSTNRNADPQLHSHAVIANSTRDPVTGKWVSIDSRQGLYSIQVEANNVYMNALAERLREAGYSIEWSIKENGAATFEIDGVPAEIRDLFSSRKAEIDAKLAARGTTRADASAAARETATLDTRSPKQHAPAAELHARWAALAGANGYDVGRLPPLPRQQSQVDRQAAAVIAVEAGIAHISEREMRFTRRDLLAAARQFSQGTAGEADLTWAVDAARARGRLLDRQTLHDAPGAVKKMVAGFTTIDGVKAERAMLDSVDRIAAGAHGKVRIGEKTAGTTTDRSIAAAIRRQEQKTGYAFTDEQRAAVSGILGRDSGIHVIQGYAGTAKTTTVLATVAAEAKAAGWRVEAMAPTHSAAKTLGDAIGVDATTVAAKIHRSERVQTTAPTGTVWIVDEAGMASVHDKAALLATAEHDGARVILVGDDKQIGSVGAGAAFRQIKERHQADTYELTDIKRQTSADLRQAVYDALHGDAAGALSKVTVEEHKDAAATAEAVGDEYMRAMGAGKSTLVVTLSRADRDAVNAAVQQRRVDAGEVSAVREVAVLRDKQWTATARADAARYQAGDVVEAGRDYKHGPRRGETATVEKVDHGKVTARTADGKAWTFDPRKTDRLAVFDRREARIGVGDRIIAKGSIRAHNGREVAEIKNGTEMRVLHAGDDGRLEVSVRQGTQERTVTIDARQGAKLDLAYAQTANQAQGRTVDVVIADARSTQHKLADQQRMYVALSRARERAIVHTDSKGKLAEQVRTHTGQKETALDERQRTAERTQVAAERESRSRVGDALRAVGRKAAAGMDALDRAAQRHIARAPLREADKTTKEMLKNIKRGADRSRAGARRGRSVIDLKRHIDVARIDAKAADSTARVKGQQVARHARWEAREAGKEQAWSDPKQRKQLVRMADGRTARSTDRGKTWREETGIKGLVDRHQSKAQAARTARIEEAHRGWVASGSNESRNSRDMAREALESYQRDRARIVPMKPREWDRMADKYGMEYDKQGHRYAYDKQGHLHSETLTKRAAAITATADGRRVAKLTEGHTAGALKGLHARHKIESAVHAGQRREVERLTAMASEKRQLGDIARAAKQEHRQAPAQKPERERSGDRGLSIG